MARKFSLEAMLSLDGSGFGAEMKKIERQVSGFSKKMQKLAKPVMVANQLINKVAKSAAVMAGAAAAATIALVQTTANAGDRFAKTSRMIGMTAEELQALTYAADLQGITGEALVQNLEKMNRNMGELKTGSGTLAAYLTKTDRALLSQLRGVKNNEEAFALLIGKLHDIPDEFGKAAFAQAAFGRSGMDMLKLAELDADALAGLTAEARKYGLISNEAAKMSEAYNDELTRLKAMALGLKNRFASALLPKLTELVTVFRKMVEGAGGGEKIMAKLKKAIDKIDVRRVVEGIRKFAKWLWDFAGKVWRTLEKLRPLLPWILGLVVGIKILSGVLIILNAIMLANPAGLIALGILALATYIGIAIANWEKFGAAMLFVLGPLGQVINFIMELKKSWASVTAAFEHGGILAGLKTIGLVLVQSVLRPIHQVLALLTKVKFIDRFLGGAREGLGELLAQTQAEIDRYNPEKQQAAGAGYLNPATEAKVVESRSRYEELKRTQVEIIAPKGYGLSERKGPPMRNLLYGVQ